MRRLFCPCSSSSSNVYVWVEAMPPRSFRHIPLVSTAAGLSLEQRRALHLRLGHTDPAAYSYGPYSYGPYRHGLYRHGLYRHGLYSHGLYGYGLYGHGRYSYGLYSHGLHSYGLHIVMAYIAVAYIVMAYIFMTCIVMTYIVMAYIYSYGHTDPVANHGAVSIGARCLYARGIYRRAMFIGSAKRLPKGSAEKKKAPRGSTAEGGN